MIYFTVFAPKIQPAQQLSRLNVLQADLIHPESETVCTIKEELPLLCSCGLLGGRRDPSCRLQEEEPGLLLGSPPLGSSSLESSQGRVLGGSPHSLHKSNAHSGGFPLPGWRQTPCICPLQPSKQGSYWSCLSLPGAMWTKATDGPNFWRS